MRGPRLKILPSVPVWQDGPRLCFDRKFYDGMLAYVTAWPGSVHCVARRAPPPMQGFGSVIKHVQDLPFSISVLEADEPIQARHLYNAEIVMAAADDYRQLEVAELCQQLHQACVYVIEYVPKTRQQINRIETAPGPRRWRRSAFLQWNERRRVRAFRTCQGLQANGLPAYWHYGNMADSMLYFDTRVGERSLIPEALRRERLVALANQGPLRLAFSGRLIGMKGADHLAPLAAALRQRGVDFRFSIFGEGDLAPSLRAQLEALALTDCVRLEGSLDFERELLPTIQSKVDLYVLPHRQGDPSCTYLETLACGIPIAGYLNEAFAGLLTMGNVGVGAATDDIDGLADAIARLDAERERLMLMSDAALLMARQHTFERTFKHRVAHLQRIAGLSA